MLDVYALNRSGVLDSDGRDIAWKFFEPSETKGFFERWDYTRMRESGRVTLRMMDGDLMRVSYDIVSRSYAYGVPIVTSPGTLGGDRRWFSCPGERGDNCDRRVAMLYLHDGLFLCRHCHGLGYWTQKATPAIRAFHRADGIKIRLGGNPGMGNIPFPWHKPKGMHWRTWDDAVMRIQMATNRGHVEMARMAGYNSPAELNAALREGSGLEAAAKVGKVATDGRRGSNRLAG